MTSARATATRCCSPPDSMPGPVLERGRASPTRASSAAARGRASAGGTPRDAQRHLDVLERGELRQQVVELEDEPDVAVAERARARVGRCRPDRASPMPHRRRRRARSSPPSTCSSVLLPDARGADDRHHLAALPPRGRARAAPAAAGRRTAVRLRRGPRRRQRTASLLDTAAPRPDRAGRPAATGRSWPGSR